MRTPLLAIVLPVLAAWLPQTGAAQMRAEVVEVRPVQTQSTRNQTREVCSRGRSGLRGRAGQILGGVAGGFAGSEFGSGSGRDLATVAGAVLGSELGRRYVDDRSRNCHTVNIEQSVESVGGYDVIYAQDGRLWRTRRAEHPGASITVPTRGEGATR